MNVNRMSYCLLVVIVFGLLTACASGPPSGNDSGELTMVSGRLEPAGMTSFMYGSHLLYDGNGRLRYALTSDTVSLSDYEGRHVIIRAVPVDGYPVDNGPPYLRVVEIGIPAQR